MNKGMNKREILKPRGIIDHTNQSQFEEELLRLIENSEEKEIIVDFSEVELVNSSGLIALVKAYQEAKKRGKSLYLTNVCPSVRMIFEISRLDKVLGIKEENYEKVVDDVSLVA